VQDFSGEDSDSPLLSQMEYCEDVAEASQLRDALCESSYALSVAHGERAAQNIGFDPTGSQTAEPELAATTLLSSGFAEHLLALNLASCGVDDAGLARLSKALVGHALYLQYISLSGNPIGDPGLLAFAGELSPRRYELMLPCLRWLHLMGLDRVGELGALSLAKALRGSALPSLEALCISGRRLSGEDLEVSDAGGHELDLIDAIVTDESWRCILLDMSPHFTPDGRRLCEEELARGNLPEHAGLLLLAETCSARHIDMLSDAA
jgi:hypothetical protein